MTGKVLAYYNIVLVAYPDTLEHFPLPVFSATLGG